MRLGDCDNRHPGAGDTLLVVEVADSSLSFDREQKAALYAPHGVPECWVVHVGRTSAQTTTITYEYRDPSLNGYQRTTEHARGFIEAESLVGVKVDDIEAQ